VVTYSISRSADVLRRLLAAGASPAGPPGVDVTPLMLAASTGNVGAIGLLLDAGAPIDAAGVNGLTPLMVAAYAGGEPAVRYLLGRGADRGLRNKDGRTAAELAGGQGHLNLAELIESASAQN
jgi:ankyrin repeat protein